MRFIKIHKTKIITGFCIVGVLLFAFFYNGCNSNKSTETEADIEEFSYVTEPTNIPQISSEALFQTPKSIQTSQNVHAEKKEKATEYSNENGIEIDIKSKTDELNIEYVPTEEVQTSELKETENTSTDLTCTLSVRCENAIGKSDEKTITIPDNGIIFKEQKVIFHEGESVFDVLLREMKKNNIHLEFVNIPLNNSTYIEGIGNLYEFDLGELSGWMYKVNNWFPNYSCSVYELKQGDKVEWVYTCDLGKDVGGEYSARNGMSNE